jgi:SAM-dependent methyltransferase
MSTVDARNVDRTEWERQYRSGRWEYLAQPAEDARYRAIVNRIRRHAAASVLDLGCGSGVLRDHLGPAYTGRYVGIDWSVAAMAGRARSASELFVCADVTTLPLRGTFDVVILSEVLYYLDEPVRVVERAVDLVAPGGALLVSLFRPSPRRHPGWHALISRLDADLRAITDNSQEVTTEGGRTWSLHTLTMRGTR